MQNIFIFVIINILFIIFNFDYLILNNLFLIALSNSCITRTQILLILFLFPIFKKQVILFLKRKLLWIIRLYITPAISSLIIKQ
jgi:hypothetical protein